MIDVVHCNKNQAEKILKIYFSNKPVVIKVSKDDEDEIYFITAKTVPGNLKTFWQYRGYACFGEVYKDDRRYDLNDGYPGELMKPLDEACEEAIRKYESGDDIFQDEEIQEIKADLQNIKHKVIKSSERGYIWTIIILSILLFFSLCKNIL